MYSDMKAMLLAMCVDKADSFGSFYGVEDAYDSLQDFLEIYRNRSVALSQSRESSLFEWLGSEYLEEGILLKSMGDDAVSNFVDEVDSGVSIFDLFFGKTSGPSNAEMHSLAVKFENKSFPKEKLASWYVELFKKNPVLMQTSRIFNDPRMKYFFSEKQLEIINQYKEKLKVGALTSYNMFIKYLRGEMEELSDARERMMFDYFSLHFADNDPELNDKIENIVTGIINNISEASIYQKEFVLKYIAYEKCKKYNLPMVNINFPHLGYGQHGESLDNTSIISVSSSDVKYADSIEKFLRVAETVTHECEHYLQFYEVNNQVDSYRSYISTVDRFLCDYYAGSDYNNNYFFREIEQEARNNGVLDASDFVKKYYKGDKRRIDSYVNKTLESYSDFQNYEYHLDNNGVLESRAKVNISVLKDALSKEPSFLNDYPVLKHIFNEDGSMKSLTDLALEYYCATDEEKRILGDAVEYICSNRKLISDVSLEQFADEKSKIGFISMIKSDFELKKSRLLLINNKLRNMNGESLRAYDEKKFLYGIADDCIDSLLTELAFLKDNLSETSSLVLENGENLSDNLSNYLNESIKMLSGIIDENLPFYSETKTKLDKLVSVDLEEKEPSAQKK